MDKTKAKIQELVPSIMELKFGCYGAYKTPSQPFEFVVRILGETAIGDIEIRNGSANYYIKKETLTSLGRPITLADVLLAIDIINAKATIDFSVEKGCIVIKNDDLDYDEFTFWDLTKSYDDQSQETKDFIGQILGVK